MFAETREQVRTHFVDVWQKVRTQEALEPIEQLVASVIEHHPEYHELLGDRAQSLASDFDPNAPGENPFLHMSLHVALHEQLQSNRPFGIVNIYETLLRAAQADTHALEHKMMNCLSASLWQAQQNSRPPDENAYLACLRAIG